jgi:hypothetical protein
MQGAIAEGQEEGIEINAVVATGNECHGWISRKPWLIIYLPLPVPLPEGEGTFPQALSPSISSPDPKREHFFGDVR